MYTGPKISKDGLVLHLDGAVERSLVSGSSTWFDLSDYGNDGSILNSPEYITNYGGGLHFISESSQEVRITTNSSLDFGSGSFTVEVIFQTNDKTDRGMIIHRNDGAGDVGWYIEARGLGDGFISTDLEDGVLTDNGFSTGGLVNGRVFHFVLQRDGDTHKNYLNGEFTSSEELTGLGDVDFSTLIRIGGTSAYYADVSVYMVRMYNRALSEDEVYRNYVSSFSRFEDYDVRRFIKRIQDDGNSLTATEINALRYLVYGFKQNGTWDKHTVIYPFVGSTSGSHKYNLKDPRDSDDAYRMTFIGSGSHSSLGYKGSDSVGGDVYAKTYFTTNDLVYSGGDVDGLVAYYSVTNVTGTATTSTEIGAGGGSGNLYYMQVQDTGGVFNGHGSNAISPQLGNDGRSDRYVVNAASSGTVNVYLFTTGSITSGSATQGSATNNTSMFTINANCNSDINGDTMFTNSNSNRTCGYAALSPNTFTYNEIKADFDVIQKFQTMLGREI